MANQRNCITRLVEYIESCGVDINIGKNKARGNKGFFKARGYDNYRIDISNKLEEVEILRVLVHEFSHYIHYTNDKTLKSTEYLFGNDFDDFRQSIINDTFVDKYNMTQNQLDKLSEEDIKTIVRDLVSDLISEDNTLKRIYDLPEQVKNRISGAFRLIYEKHLGRFLNEAEHLVLMNAVSILFARMYFRKFSAICHARYNTLCKRSRGVEWNKNANVAFMMGYSDLPDINLRKFPVVPYGTKVSEVDFDTIIYDTYDYLDKLIGFKLTDIFCSAINLYYIDSQNERASVLEKLIRYGTSDEKEIYMIRYGLSFEDIAKLGDYIEAIDETGIRVIPAFYDLPKEVQSVIERFV